MDNLILDIFYNQIIHEATTGRIDCQAFLNIIFATQVSGKFFLPQEDNPNLVIPTLVINNKEQFDALLVDYVMASLDFYNDDDFGFFGIDECTTKEE